MERRTLQEIYDQINIEKAEMSSLNEWVNNSGHVLDDNQTLLDDLTTPSKVGIWRLFIWIVAVAIWIHEGLWLVFKSEVDTAIDKHTPHTERWYQESSKIFQYGDELAWNDDTRKYEYEITDANKQIIKRSAAVSNGGIVAIKVATDVNGSIAPLSATQKTAFAAFWKKYRDAGVIINIISTSADLLKLQYDIYFDPLVLSPDGSLISNSSIFPVADAIENYIANLDFNGRFRLEACDAVIKSAQGVIDFSRTLAQSKFGTNDYTDISVSEIAYSGYYNIDTNFPLSSNITYIANV